MKVARLRKTNPYFYPDNTVLCYNMSAIIIYFFRKNACRRLTQSTAISLSHFYSSYTHAHETLNPSTPEDFRFILHNIETTRLKDFPLLMFTPTNLAKDSALFNWLFICKGIIRILASNFPKRVDSACSKELFKNSLLEKVIRFIEIVFRFER